MQLAKCIVRQFGSGCGAESRGLESCTNNFNLRIQHVCLQVFLNTLWFCATLPKVGYVFLSNCESLNWKSLLQMILCQTSVNVKLSGGSVQLTLRYAFNSGVI